MANTFTGVGLTTRAAFDILYTTPASTQSIVKSLYFANHSAATVYVSATAEVDGGTTTVYLLNSGQLPPNTTLQLLDGNFVLNAGCELKVYCDQSSSVDASASILEIS